VSAAPIPQIFDDEAVRRRIRTSLRESLIVEAAAGTGKTSELVRRIVAVLQSGLTTVDRIVAVTFTQKAAGELKLRLRQGLDRQRAATQDPAEVRCIEDALARLEEASIGTIHAFCAQILRERPVEARVDPAFQEVSEQESARLFERAFRGWIEHRLNESSPGLRRALVRLAWRDIHDGNRPPMEQLEFAARSLLEWRDYPAPWERIHFDRTAEIDRLAAFVRDQATRLSTGFRPVHECAEWLERSEAALHRDYDTMEALLLKLHRELKRIKRKGVEQLLEPIEKFRDSADADLAYLLREEMLDLVDRYEQQKRRAGGLDFLDLLLLARDLVRDNTEVRTYLQNRFTHIFVDEFQDTDPLQAELLLLLASEDPAQSDWMAVRPAGGKLFLVGDPKQSIYKFRRADVILYQTLRGRLAEKGVPVVYLTRSHRSVRPIQSLVNAAFEPEMTGDPIAGQAGYVPLTGDIEPAPDQPSVVVLPVPRPYATRYPAKSAINRSLPDAIAAYTEWLLRESGWTVRDPEHPQRRIPVRARDVCILFRRFLNFGEDLTRDYTRSLEARGVPHLLVGSKSFHAREEVETMRAALTAIEWPDDELSVFAALRGPLFSISDAVLLRYRHAHQRLHPFRIPETADAEFGPVAEALATLAGLHRGRNRRPVAGTVNLLLEAARAHAAFGLRPAGRQVLANVYRIVDLARSFEAEGGISFRGFVEHLARQAEKAESAEAPVIEEGAEGVRLMTVHAAKGLEFPVVILADMTANIAARDPDRYLDGQKRLCAMRLLRCAPWELLAHETEERAREQAEGVRVAYVAATRARDLLVVPAVGDQEMDGWLEPLNKAIYPPLDRQRRPDPAPGCPRFGNDSVLERPPDLLAGPEMSVRPGLHFPKAGGHTVVWWDPHVLRLGVQGDAGLRQEEILAGGSTASLEEYLAWREARDRVTESGRTPLWSIFTASEAPHPPEGFTGGIRLESAPRKGERPGGRRFGTLVHAILRDVSFTAGRESIEAIATLHGRLLDASPEETAAAADAVESALGHTVLAAARAAREVRRETPVICRTGPHLLEGVVDLAYHEPDGWTLVDYKTDDDVVARRKHYEAQLAWYLHAFAKLTGEPVRGVLLSL